MSGLLRDTGVRGKNSTSHRAQRVLCIQMESWWGGERDP